MNEKELGPKHKFTLCRLKDLGVAHLVKGEYELALKVFEDIEERGSLTNDPFWLKVREMKGLCLYSLKQF